MPRYGLSDGTVLLYAACLCGFFVDYLENNRKAHRIAFWLLVMVWFFQAALFYVKMRETGEFPILTPLDGLFFLSWLIVSLTVLLSRFFYMDFFVFFANLAGFAAMAISLFGPDDRVPAVLSQHLMNDLLIIHIIIAFVAYAAFTASFIAAIMYAMEYSMLKKKKWGSRLVRFGSLAKLEQAAFLFNLAGFPLLMVSLILGVVRAVAVIKGFSWLDAKVVTSFIVLIAYAWYLYQRIGRGVHGIPLVFWNAVSFLLVLINVFLSETLTAFHLW